MSRPRKQEVNLAVHAVMTGELSQSDAAKKYNVARSTIIRAIKSDQKRCPCCGQIIHKKTEVTNE